MPLGKLTSSHPRFSQSGNSVRLSRGLSTLLDNGGYFAACEADTSPPDPIALGHGEKYLDLADQDQCRVQLEAGTSAPVEEAQTGAADEKEQPWLP